MFTGFLTTKIVQRNSAFIGVSNKTWHRIENDKMPLLESGSGKHVIVISKIFLKF